MLLRRASRLLRSALPELRRLPVIAHLPRLNRLMDAHPVARCVCEDMRHDQHTARHIPDFPRTDDALPILEGDPVPRLPAHDDAPFAMRHSASYSARYSSFHPVLIAFASTGRAARALT